MIKNNFIRLKSINSTYFHALRSYLYKMIKHYLDCELHGVVFRSATTPGGQKEKGEDGVDPATEGGEGHHEMGG